MDRVELRVSPSGAMRFLHNDEVLSALRARAETLEIRRASHVEPFEGGTWIADMSPVGGPILTSADGSGFETRQEALEAEVAYLREHGIPLPRN